MKVVNLFLTILFIAAFATASFGQNEAEQKLIIYKDSKYPFSFSYPTDWRQPEPSNPQFRLRLIKNDGLYVASFNIRVSYVESRRNMSAKAHVDELARSLKAIEAGYKREHPSTKIVSSWTTRISGREAFYVKAQATSEVRGAEREIISYQIQTADSGYFYTLTFVSEANGFKENFPVFEAIADSFVIN